jgi:hypothetical protein
MLLQYNVLNSNIFFQKEGIIRPFWNTKEPFQKLKGLAFERNIATT